MQSDPGQILMMGYEEVLCNSWLLVVFVSQLNLQERLKMAEEQIVSNNEGESQSVEDLKAEAERREKALRNAVEERDNLMSELEELDRQNQEATQV